ncbi:hypothetical protein KCP69_26865 (plasmid) [Salmonella enterica subsp. enterica]|nr:hypothetical protein KCP69_26865 [Salmonella enterica subsp. enterica]
MALSRGRAGTRRNDGKRGREAACALQPGVQFAGVQKAQDTARKGGTWNGRSKPAVDDCDRLGWKPAARRNRAAFNAAAVQT